MEKVKACPFCGEEPELEYMEFGNFVACENSKCYVSPSVCDGNNEGMEYAIKAWNIRASDRNAVLDEAIDAVNTICFGVGNIDYMNGAQTHAEEAVSAINNLKGKQNDK